ncbi:phage tail assembly protein [Mergibacter septicus]|nr:phage tail assembly protein [Mergibacter septicus]UTU48075.1 phage tail assembly protein [Mergibacter septicus]WMR96312.1 phage tail assembly protein [Mergibacter septicus]
MNQATTLLKNLQAYTTYTLSYPITQPDGTQIKEVVLRRIKGSDQAAFESQQFDMEKDNYKINRFFIVRLSNLLPEDVDEMDLKDILGLGELITKLINEGKSDK